MVKKLVKIKHDMMWSDKSYDKLDKGIRFAVKVLHAHGIETGQSCQGGKGHSYDHPTIDTSKGDSGMDIFGAFYVLSQYGLPVRDISLVWDIGHHGVPGECIGRITFHRTMEDRADEWPMFVCHYMPR